jgi:very-short-patch-repair endonuclease
LIIIFFDFLVAARLLIEVDETHHRDASVRQNDAAKNKVATRYRYKLLRIEVPFDNVGKYLGKVVRLLAE